MTSALLLAAVGQAFVFAQTIERAASAVDAMKNGSVQLRVETSFEKKKTLTTASINFLKPDTMLLRLKEPIQGDFDATDRSYRIQRTTMVAYDHRWNEFLNRKNLPKGTLAERADVGIGNLGEPFSCVLSGSTLKMTLTRFASMGDWALKREPSGSSLAAFNSQNKARLLLTFDKLGRLTRVALNQTNSYSNWTYVYGSAAATDIEIPKEAKAVSQFTARPAPPKFEDSMAKKIYQDSLFSYERLKSYQLEVESGIGTTRLWVSGRNLRGEDSAKTWSYRFGQCAVIDRSTNRFYTGKVSSATLIDALGNLKLSVASWPRWALLNNNPLQTMFNSSFTIRSAGSIKLAGTEMHVLQISGPRWSGSMQVSGKTKLLASLAVKTVDTQGRVVSVSTQSLRYSGIGMPIPAQVFLLGPPKGAKTATIKSLIKVKR
jgi:hypothetical protein